MTKMNLVESLLVMSPFRALLARGEADALLRWAQLPAGATVLDLGCGPGMLSVLLARKAQTRLVAAFDLDAAMVKRARRRAGNLPVAPLVADATHMPYAGSQFDAVFVVGVLHHIPDWRAAIPEVARALKPGGRFCFAEPSRSYLMKVYRLLPHQRDAMFTADEWRSALAASSLQFEGEFHRLPLWDICGVATKPS
ncbi:MAG: class I SAM-dependent methyltransferase [Dehalococcoidia bacterium]|jgi:ubiquinone/menaquinone biosynthesis C-methylase UbiE